MPCIFSVFRQRKLSEYSSLKNQRYKIVKSTHFYSTADSKRKHTKQAKLSICSKNKPPPPPAAPKGSTHTTLQLLFIYLLAAPGLSCSTGNFDLHGGMWDLVPWPGIEPGPPALWPAFNFGVRKIPWRREWLPTSVFLPGESHGQRSLVG